MSDNWEPIGDDLDLPQVIAQALGSASVCWSETPAGEFDSRRASEIVDGVLRWLDSQRVVVTHYEKEPHSVMQVYGPVDSKAARRQQSRIRRDAEVNGLLHAVTVRVRPLLRLSADGEQVVNR